MNLSVRELKEKLARFLSFLSFRNIWNDLEEDDWEDYDFRDDYVSGADETYVPTERATTASGMVLLVIVLLVIGSIIVYQLMSRRHMYTSWIVTDSYSSDDILGTRYRKLGSGFIKYGSDGVTYVNGRNETQWSIAYTIETPQDHSCDDTMIIYEQQGYTVEVLDTSGLLGSFQTSLPIMQARVAGNGVCALMLKDEKDSRINIVETDGTALAEVKTTLEDQGYPLAMDLSSDGQDLIVSLAKIGQGTIDSAIVFYNFSSASLSDESHLISSMDYEDEIFPFVCFVSDKTGVAAGDSGFVTFALSDHPEEKKNVTLPGEILSMFYDDDYIGFVMQSGDDLARYRLQVYKYSGKKTADITFTESYSEVKMDSGEILFNDTGHMMVFTPGGVMRFDADYDDQISEFVKIPGFRKYAVLTNSGIDRIYIE